jgi:hypothetical protein
MSRNGRKIIKSSCGIHSSKRSKVKIRASDNKMIHNLTPTQQFMQKRGLSPDSMCFFYHKNRNHTSYTCMTLSQIEPHRNMLRLDV